MRLGYIKRIQTKIPKKKLKNNEININDNLKSKSLKKDDNKQINKNNKKLKNINNINKNKIKGKKSPINNVFSSKNGAPLNKNKNDNIIENKNLILQMKKQLKKKI